MLDSYWFGFLLQVVAIGVAGLAALSLFGAARRGALALALAGVAVVLLAGQYALGVRPAVGYLQSVDDKFASVPDKAGGRTWCVNEPGLPDLSFIRFVQSVMPPGSRYELFIGDEQERLNVPLCLALIFAPSVQTTDPARAQYRIFFGVVPDEHRDEAREGQPGYHGYAPDMGVLEAGG